MKRFDINRFFRTLRWLITENKQKLMLWTSGSAVGVFLMQMFFYMMIRNSQEPYMNYIAMVMGFCLFFVILASMISISGLFSDLNTKQRRIAFFSLPAANLEKYLALVVYVGVVNVACIFLAYVVGDTLRMFTVSLIDKYELVSSVPMLLEAFKPSDLQHGLHFSFPILMLECGMMLWGHSVYTLGGTFFRKYAFVIVSMSLFVLMMVGTYCLVHFSMNFTLSDFDRSYINPVVYLGTFLFFALACLNYVQSYRLFKRTQIITSKWINL